MILEILEKLKIELENCNEQYCSALISSVLKGDEDKLESFLISNELWGGSGSIADQACMQDEMRTDERRKIEKLLIILGDELLRLNKVNVRTNLWVNTFKQWADKGT